MSATTYRFTHACTVAATPAQVLAVLVDLPAYPTWWPQVRAVASIDEDTALVVCRSTLPYDLELVLRPVNRELPRPEVRIDGQLVGFARWTLTPQDEGTRLDYEQVVTTQGRLFTLLSHAARPILRWNHAVMMRGCERGLTELFGAARLDAVRRTTRWTPTS